MTGLPVTHITGNWAQRNPKVGISGPQLIFFKISKIKRKMQKSGTDLLATHSYLLIITKTNLEKFDSKRARFENLPISVTLNHFRLRA